MKIKSVSATQYTDYARCPRFWYFKNIEKLPTPTTKSLDLGTAIHDGAEKRIKAGTMDVVDPAVRDYVLALDKAGYFPAPSDAVCESWMRIDTHLGVPWIGKVDLVIPSLATVRDWKSSSSIARYAKVPMDLEGDLQVNSYGEWAYQVGHIPASRDATLELVYVQTPAPKKTLPQTKRVAITTSRSSVRAVWDGAKRQLDAMARTSEASCADDVTPNTLACGDYGGCPFKSTCSGAVADLYEGIGSFKSGNSSTTGALVMGFMDRYKNLGGTNGNGAHPPQAAPVPPVTQAPAETSAAEWNAKQEARAAAEQAHHDAQQNAARGSAPAPGQIVADDAPPRDTYTAPTPDEQPEAAATPAAPDDTAQAAAEAEPAPKKRGRPKKAPEATGEAVQAMQAAQLPAQMGQVTQYQKAPTAAPTQHEFVIYVDCYPTKGRGSVDPTFADDWFAPLEMELNELAMKENKPSYWMFDFGTQKAALAVGVQERIKKGLPRAMVFRSGSNVTREILPYLAPHATQIIQAMR